jgi:hypothetical protein
LADALLRVEADDGYGLRPQFQVGGDQRGELLRRIAEWIGAEARQPLDEFRIFRRAGLSAKIALDRTTNPWSNGRTVIASWNEKAPTSVGGGTGEAGASIPRWRERGHSRICHPSMEDEVDPRPWRVIGPHGNVRH